MMNSKASSLSLFIWVGLSMVLVNWVSGNSEGDALVALKRSLKDPDNVLESWDPNLVSPCTWFHITCNSDNHVTRVYFDAYLDEGGFCRDEVMRLLRLEENLVLNRRKDFCDYSYGFMWWTPNYFGIKAFAVTLEICQYSCNLV